MKVTKTRLLKIIRKHCFNCCCGSYKEVELCPDTDCVLYPYRMGIVPVKEKAVEKIVDLIEESATVVA